MGDDDSRCPFCGKANDDYPPAVRKFTLALGWLVLALWFCAGFALGWVVK